MEIIHDAEDLRFYALLGEEEAELTYTYPEEKVVDFDHTFVPESQRGKGVAGALAKAGLDFIKANKLRFIPSCPVVEAYAKRHPEYQPFMD